MPWPAHRLDPSEASLLKSYAPAEDSGRRHRNVRMPSDRALCALVFMYIASVDLLRAESQELLMPCEARTTSEGTNGFCRVRWPSKTHQTRKAGFLRGSH
jgi:hypothetical protein